MNNLEGYNTSIKLTGLKDLYKKDFLIGLGITGNDISNCMFRNDKMTSIAKHHFNSFTYTNLTKAKYILDYKSTIEKMQSEGCDTGISVIFDSCKEGLEFCKKNNLKMRWHTLIWHSDFPSWFFYEKYDIKNKLLSKDKLIKRMESYIGQVMCYINNNYEDVIYAWDVVNEAIELDEGSYDPESSFFVRTKCRDKKLSPNLWYEVLGEKYVEIAFQIAKKYVNKKAKLFYNDYNTFDNLKMQSIIKMISQINGNNDEKLIDGIGMQSYVYFDEYPIISDYYNALLEYSRIGLEINITELSVGFFHEYNEDQQAEYFKRLFKALLEAKNNNDFPVNITSVTFFGLMDNNILYENDNQKKWIFNKDLGPKKAYWSLKELK